MSIARAYVLESRYEFVKLLRLPAYLVPTVAFPLMFYAFFGLMYGSRHIGALTQATYLLASYGAFGIIGATLFGFGVSVAVERAQGWMLVKRASPMPPFAYFAAKIATSTAFGITIVLLMFALGALFGNVRLPASTWLAMGGSLVLGALPFAALGLAIGYLAGPNSAPAIVNIVYLPMSFLSGLWIPLVALPPLVQHIAPLLPAYHLAALALGTMGAGDGNPWWTHALALVGFTAVFLAGAAFGLRRDEGKLYG
ncbi:MAG: ABC transporter permease [Candidatus Velthaea sp.]